eukprot:GSChrysophyteH2.ASY1.ANO1.1503.1 assembled CDS
MAPLVPHMAEDVWQNLPYEATTASVFQRQWPFYTTTDGADVDARHLKEKWDLVRSVRSDVNKCMEVLRGAKKIGASQECRAVLHCPDPETAQMLRNIQGDASFLEQPATTDGCDDLRFVFIASQVTVVDTEEELIAQCRSNTTTTTTTTTESGVSVGITRAKGRKCDRCWYYSESVGLDVQHADVCARCAAVIRVDKHAVESE